MGNVFRRLIALVHQSSYGTDSASSLRQTPAASSKWFNTLEPVAYGNQISQWRGGAGAYYLFDGLGSTTQLTNF